MPETPPPAPVPAPVLVDTVSTVMPPPTVQFRVAGQVSAVNETATTHWISVDTDMDDIGLGGPEPLYDVWSERQIEPDGVGAPSREPGFFGMGLNQSLYWGWVQATRAARERGEERFVAPDRPEPADICQPGPGRVVTGIRREPLPAPLRRESLGVAALRARGRPPITRDDPAWGIPEEA